MFVPVASHNDMVIKDETILELGGLFGYSVSIPTSTNGTSLVKLCASLEEAEDYISMFEDESDYED